MVEKEEAELVALCSSILDHGEVTADEAYQLADWLNQHDEAAEHWPGNQLVAPLQEVWADGNANPRELHRLARLLISVQREWARRPRTKITLLTSGELPRISTDQIEEVRLPALNGRYRIPSQSEPGRFYEVNLYGPTCTCPDWRNRRSRWPVGDLTRCCKHILHTYARLLEPTAADNWLVAFLQQGWPPHPEARWRLLDLNGSKVLFSTASERGWADVFAAEGDRYESFGYNALEDRWAYGIEPADATTIANAVVNFRGEEPALVPSSEQPPAIYSYVAKVPAVNVLPATALPVLPTSIAPSLPQKRGNRWALAAGAMVLLLVIAVGLFAAHAKKPDQPAALAPSPPSVVRLSPSSPATTPAAAPWNATAQSSTRPAIPAAPWTVVMRQNVKAKGGRKDIVIPRGTAVKVIAGSNRDLMVSYKGQTLTIPASATTPGK